MPALERDVGETRGANSFPDNPTRLGKKFGHLEKKNRPLCKKTFSFLVSFFSQGANFSIISVSKKKTKLFQNLAFTGKIQPQFGRGFLRTLTFFSAPFKLFGRTFSQLATLWSNTSPPTCFLS
jgi:hypothetical protein